MPRRKVRRVVRVAEPAVSRYWQAAQGNFHKVPTIPIAELAGRFGERLGGGCSKTAFALLDYDGNATGLIVKFLSESCANNIARNLSRMVTGRDAWRGGVYDQMSTELATFEAIQTLAQVDIRLSALSVLVADIVAAVVDPDLGVVGLIQPRVVPADNARNGWDEIEEWNGGAEVPIQDRLLHHSIEFAAKLGISDLHNANVGYTSDGFPVFLDYALGRLCESLIGLHHAKQTGDEGRMKDRLAEIEAYVSKGSKRGAQRILQASENRSVRVCDPESNLYHVIPGVTFRPPLMLDITVITSLAKLASDRNEPQQDRLGALSVLNFFVHRLPAPIVHEVLSGHWPAPSINFQPLQSENRVLRYCTNAALEVQTALAAMDGVETLPYRAMLKVLEAYRASATAIRRF